MLKTSETSMRQSDFFQTESHDVRFSHVTLFHVLACHPLFRCQIMHQVQSCPRENAMDHMHIHAGNCSFTRYKHRSNPCMHISRKRALVPVNEQPILSTSHLSAIAGASRSVTGFAGASKRASSPSNN